MTSSEEGPSNLLIVAGEASGDLHGSLLLRELRTRRPSVKAFGLGSDQLRAEGCELVADSREIAVVGLTEALRILPRAKQIFRQLLDEVERRDIRTAVLVDFPEFNLRLARQLHRRGVRVIYYISPQIWAWRRRRVEQVRRTVHTMLVLFPFEVDFYRRFGVEVQHVGHPLVDEVPALPQVWERDPATERRVLALLPGSRRSEVSALLPKMLESAALLVEDHALEIRLIEAPSVEEELFDEILAGSSLEVHRIKERRFEAIASSHLALCASGTATLEVGLLGTPMVVLYQLSRVSYFLAKLLVDLPHFALVNLVLDQRAVPELIQAEASEVAATASPLLNRGSELDAVLEALGGVRQALGAGGASGRAAEAVIAAAGWEEKG